MLYYRQLAVSIEKVLQSLVMVGLFQPVDPTIARKVVAQLLSMPLLRSKLLRPQGI
jgi:hypothetical protein